MIAGLGVNTRVLMIGAHPDDEDTDLITWLQRGRYVETAYLSLTRGDGGQNLIGNELGEALGVIRTQELLAARRIDGAQQYFTRAFDFGFSKDTIDTFNQWQRDSLLGDVVRTVREFQPHVIVAVFSGTPRDGHGHHQVSGLLARIAYDLAGDITRFPIATYGAPWTPLKFYRAARGNAQNGTLGIDVGEYSPLLGRSYAEIAGESRSQHKSQGFGALQRKGPVMNYVRREASRVNEATAANVERSLFDGIDTTWGRFRSLDRDPAEGNLDSVAAMTRTVRAAFDPFSSGRAVAALNRLRRRLLSLRFSAVACKPETIGSDLCRDFSTSLAIADSRATSALLADLGVDFDVRAARELLIPGRNTKVVATVYNRGRDTIRFVWSGDTVVRPVVAVPPGGVSRDSVTRMPSMISEPRWLSRGRIGAMFSSGMGHEPSKPVAGLDPVVFASIKLGSDTQLEVTVPVKYQYVDAVKGDMSVVASGVPTVSVTLDQPTQYVVTNSAIDRLVNVRVVAGDSVSQVRVTLSVPRGMTVDSATRTIELARYNEPRTIGFRVRGRLPAGEHRIEALAELNGVVYRRGYDLIDYDHIRAQRIYRPASMRLSAVDVKVPANLRVAYVPGVGDNVAPTLTQLGVPTTVVSAAEIARVDLSSYSTVVIGPRAYEAHPELFAANPKLFDFARKGGVLLVQYGQYEMTQRGAMPFPITLSRPADRVTLEDAPVTIDAAGARELTYPNRINAADFDGWVQERGLYMPRTFDPAYRSLFSTNDPNEPANKGGVLVAPVGDGLYIYATLSFFRQLPAGVPGGARLFVNLLSAKLAPSGVTP